MQYIKKIYFPKEYAMGLVKLLNPIVPHITEEIWEVVFNNKESIAYESWPTYDENKIVDETFTMIVQVNGKVRGKIEVDSNTNNEEMEKLALEIDNVKAFTEGKEIVKVIVVPKKLVNIVVK